MAATRATVEINVELDVAGRSVPVLVDATFYDAEWENGRVAYAPSFDLHSAWWDAYEVSEELGGYYDEQIWEAYRQKCQDDDEAYSVAVEDYQLSRYEVFEKAYC